MPKRSASIPVNNFGGEFDTGIVIETLSFDDLPDLREWNQPERHDRHSFFLLQKGTVTMEIDFDTYAIRSPAIIYMHPNQIHRVVGFESVTVSSWAVNNENLNAGYLQLLEDITPAEPLPLTEETFSLINASVSLCLKLAEHKIGKLYHSLLKDSCNTLVGLVISQYADRPTPADRSSRFETITKAFNVELERYFTTVKSPAAYARKLNISTAYLNECVKNTTGHSVSHHIQQRVILEAKRLLYHSDKSVKEIAASLGYDDHPYFSRLFTKISGMPALAFRNKNRE